MKKTLVGCVLGAFLWGCQSYDIMQTNMFSDEDGNVVRVDYGRSESKHVNTFVNPNNGKTMDFTSNLVVDVVLPDGDSFTAWQCMNFLQSGTMYRTDNEKWMVHVTGFSMAVYQLEGKETGRYVEVYRGILCESPKSGYKPNQKWRNLKKDAEGNWR